MRGLVLSLFPGLGIWEIPFAEAGWCVVRGPDLLLGHDIRNFHGIAGHFDGIIGGIPCQSFSKANALCGGAANTRYQGIDITPEFSRIVQECRPNWWLTENVADAPLPQGARWNAILDALHFGSLQTRRRRFCSNLTLMPIPTASMEEHWPTVTASEHKVSSGSSAASMRARAGRKIGRRMTLQELNAAFGLDESFSVPALKVEYHYHMLGNAVPLPMARALCNSVIKALWDTVDII